MSCYFAVMIINQLKSRNACFIYIFNLAENAWVVFELRGIVTNIDNQNFENITPREVAGGDKNKPEPEVSIRI